jgi:type IV pilus assembly protein PilY1
MKGTKITAISAGFAVLIFYSNISLSFGAAGPTLNDYCITPPFVMQQVPPEVLFAMGKDHKMYYAAYNDSSDISGPNGEDAKDGILETGYKHAIDYYGYFDSNKCYSYSSGKFTPYGHTSNKYCEASGSCTNSSGTGISCSGKWSGNFLNWLAMSRADIIKLVIYGGYRTADNQGDNYAEISGEWIPQDAHIWGKEYLGSDASSLFPDAVNNRRALFCVKGTTANGKQISMLNIIPNVDNVVAGATAANSLRAWNWVNVEGNGNTDICSDSKIDLPTADANADTPSTNSDGKLNGLKQFNISVKVCDPGDGFMGDDWETKHCKRYPDPVTGTRGRPVGLMQIYGETTSSDKVCSKDLYTACNSNSTCSGASPSKGECVDKTQMYFGLMMGSYQNPKAGGYLRKNIWSIMNETDRTNGQLQTSDPDGKGLIMKSVEELKCPTTYPLSSHWGNPIGELLYESMRFWAGRGSPTSDFVSGISNGNNGDNNYYASKPAWERPADLFPSCSTPFVLLFSDRYNSYDDDQLPGSAFSSFSGDLTNLNVQTLANAISANEQLASTSTMIGQSGTTSGANANGSCTAKTISGLADIRGICPGEGDLKGSYYSAAVAYYGHTKLKQNYTNSPNVNTFVVSFDSILPEMQIISDGKTARFLPTGKTTTDNASCPGIGTVSYDVANDTSTTPSKGAIVTPTGQPTDCGTLQTTTLYVMGTPNDNPTNPTDPDSPRYDASGNLTYIKFRWASDNLGPDYDLDFLEEYEICSASNSIACKKYDGTTLTMSPGQIAVTVRGVTSAAGRDAALGFVISGTGNTDGLYLPVKKENNPSFTASTLTLPEDRTIIFNVTGGGAIPLKDPLWYTAKYGGFKDMDGNGLPFTDTTCDPKTRGASPRNPKCSEWDSKGNGDPDNYFLISNPRQVESKLRDALEGILNKTASGTAASILSNNDNNGAMLLQAIFYPKKIYDTQTVNWIGELHGLWYYIDPFLLKNSIREDTDSNNILNLKSDYKTEFNFDEVQSETVVQRKEDTNGNQSVYNPVGDPVSPDDVMSIWRAGRTLWTRNISSSPRTLYTVNSSGSRIAFNSAAAAGLATELNVTTTDAPKVVNFVLGTDQTSTGFNRSRAVTIDGVDGTWRLGDIVSSTPRLESSVAANVYNEAPPVGYNDNSYGLFIKSNNYTHRNMAFVGANDGMLHAFNLGQLSKATRDPDPANINHFNVSEVTDTNTGGLGKEMWGFIPRNSLPYLKYLADPTYNHIYYVDGSPSINDVAINPVNNAGLTPAHTCANPTDYWTCDKVTTVDNSNNLVMDDTSWRTMLVVGSGLGGASRNSTGSCASSSSGYPNCVKTPVSGLGYSSYLALDVTDPNSPQYLWEFSNPAMGYATSGAAFVRVGDKTHNGRWFVVFGSGPTGPINTATHQFLGASDQSLKIFIVDAKTGTLLRTIDTGPGTPPAQLNLISTAAFAGSITNATVDADRSSAAASGFYSDDVIYLGYTKKDSGTGTWTKGGVLRILTHESQDPTAWTVSTLIDDTGPVTSGISKIQEDPRHFTSNSRLWLYFGTGRYFFKAGVDVDDPTNRQSLYGITEPCYQNGHINASCTASPIQNDKTTTGDLQDETTITAMGVGKKGWVIDLAQSDSSNFAQRVITDTVALRNGVVLFTAFKPSAEVCKFGGSTSLWAVTYDAGGAVPGAALQGQAVIQESTGSFQEVQLQNAFINSGGRETNSYQGVPPQTPPAFFTKAGLIPQRKILRMHEN